MEYSSAWVAFLDVFGFSALVRSAKAKKAKELISRLSDAHTAVRKDFSQVQSPAKTFIFSDSMFLVYKFTNSSSASLLLNRCVDDVCRMMDLFAKRELPLRGGIAFGSITLDDNVLLGEPVLQAVDYERIAIAPVVLLPQAQLNAAGCTGDSLKLPSQMVPTRNGGLLKAHVIGPYNKRDYLRFIDRRIEQTAVEGPYEVAQAWQLAKNLLQPKDSKGSGQ